MFYVVRYFFRYGHEWDPIDCTYSRNFPTFEKALAHGLRYATGIKFESFSIYETETGREVYHMNDEGIVTDNREEGRKERRNEAV